MPSLPSLLETVEAVHALASHDVSDPLASSLAAFVVPAAQAVHALEDTYSFAAHEFAEHVAAVSIPALHEDVPDTMYPELHVGWHVDPLAIELVQSPISPFVGAVDVSHLVSHVPKLVQTPVCDVPEQPNTVAPVVEQSGSCAPQPQSHPSSAS